MLLADRVALVTGAGSGIGRAVSVAFARAGAFVILVGRRIQPLEATYDLVEAEGGEATIAPLDLERDLPRLPEVAGRIRDRFGRLDILVNNAALAGILTPLANTEPTQWESVLRVNVTAPFFLTQSLLPLLKEAPTASVINVISGVATHGRAYWGAYAAAKAALLNLTQTWADELQRTTVRINAVNPGATATSMRATAFPGENPNTLPDPASITPVFLYLASDQARAVNGQLLQAREWQEWRP